MRLNFFQGLFSSLVCADWKKAYVAIIEVMNEVITNRCPKSPTANLFMGSSTIGVHYYRSLTALVFSSFSSYLEGHFIRIWSATNSLFFTEPNTTIFSDFSKSCGFGWKYITGCSSLLVSTITKEK